MARGEVGIPPEVLREAAEPTFARIRADVARVKPVPVGKLLRYIAEHLFDEGLTITAAKRATGIRGNTIVEYCRRQLRSPPKHYLEDRRVEVAERLRERMPELSLERIAEAIGIGTARTLAVARKRWRQRQAEEPYALPASVLPVEAELGFAERLLRARARADKLTAGVASVRHLLLPECLDLPPEQRKTWLTERLATFKSPALFRALLRLSREGCRDDRKLGVEVAEDALEVLKALQGTLEPEELAELEIEGLAWLGQAQLLAIDLVGARETLGHAKARLAQSAAPPQLMADVLELEGQLFSFERNYGQALVLLSRVCALREEVAEPLPLIRTLLEKGFVHEVLGELELAQTDFERAHELIGPTGDLYLGVAVTSRLSTIAATMGDWETAGRELAAAHELAAKIPSRSVWCRLWWIEGLQARQRADARRAEEHFIAARIGLRTGNDARTAAIVTLDLAILYAETGRRKEILALVAEVLPIVEALQYLPDQVEAIRLLRAAAAEEHNSLDQLKQVRQQLALRGGVSCLERAKKA